ncbi:hypothetical protein B0A55_01517 [Friedmanniomyces simplex]|uniref:Uncharacterized protein n=1 Tax=Friedmanniomyces simplex TaxID=329884 RepID=A0A4U0Y3G4_9PEZI|nr:hypothetical protein B0A55_01517 [Friedmanniomyces simplex]
MLGGAQKTSASDIEDYLDTVPAIKLLAASWAALPKDGMKTAAAKVEEIGNLTWAGLIKDGMETAAAEVEKLGKLAHGDGLFKAAMSDAVGGPRDNA